MAMQRRQLSDSPRNPFAEGRRGSDVSDGEDSRFGPQKHPYRRFNFKLALCVFAGMMIAYGIYSQTTTPQAEVSDYVKFDIKAAPPSNSGSSFQSQTKKLIPSDLTEGTTEDEEEDNDDEEAEKADEPDFSEYEEEGMKEKKSGDGVDENAVDEKAWTHAVKVHTEAKAVAEAKQQEDERKDTEATPDKKIEGSPKKEANITASQVNSNEMKNSDDKEKKGDKNSTKIAADKPKPDKDVEIANEKIHAKEKITETVNDEKERRQEKPLSDAVKGDTKAKSVAEEKQQLGEQKEGDQKYVSKIKPDKKVADPLEKGANNTKPQVDDKEMTNSNDEGNKDDKNSTKIADDMAMPGKDVEVIDEKIHAEEKLIKSVKDEKGQGQEKPLSGGVKGDIEMKTVVEGKQQKDEQNDTNGNKKGFDEMKRDKKVEHSLEKGGNNTKQLVDYKAVTNSDKKENNNDKNSTKIEADKAMPDKDVEIVSEEIHTEKKLLNAFNDEKGKGKVKPLSDAVKGDSEAESVDEDKREEDEQNDTKGDKKGVDGLKPDKKVEDSPEKGANIATPKIDDNAKKNTDDRENKDDKNSTKFAVDAIKPGKDIRVATDKTRAEEKLTKPLSQVERIAASMNDDEAKTDDTEDKKKSTSKDAGKKMAITPEKPADDEAAKALKSFAAKGVTLDGKDDKKDEQSKSVNEAKPYENIGRVASGKVDETKTQADEKDEVKKLDGKVNTDDNRTSDKNAISKTATKVSGKPKVTALNTKAAEVARRDVEEKSSLRGKKGAMAMKITTSSRAVGGLA